MTTIEMHNAISKKISEYGLIAFEELSNEQKHKLVQQFAKELLKK